MQETPKVDEKYAHLHREYTAGVRWVTTNLRYLEPQEDGGWQHYLERVHALTELALAYACLHDWSASASGGPLRWDPCLTQWRATILRNCNSDAYVSAVRTNPEHGLDMMQLYMWMRSTGYRSTRNEETVAYLKHLDCHPNTIGQLHSLWKGGYVSRDPGWAGLCQKTVSSIGAPTLSVPIEHAYDLTHTIFYATDFGNRPLCPREQESERAIGTTERLLSRWSSAGEWDVASELLASLNCLGVDNVAAARALAEARLDDGSIAVNLGAPRMGRAIGREEQFWLRYHATLVDTLRCAIAINKFALRRDGVSHNDLSDAEPPVSRST